MKTLNHVVCGAAMCAALLIRPVAAQELKPSQLNLHDGIWQVDAEPNSGSCSKRYQFRLSVDGGKISYAGMWSVDARGSVSALGLIRMRVVQSGGVVAANGVVRGNAASGKWASAKPRCSGSWVAHKK